MKKILLALPLLLIAQLSLAEFVLADSSAVIRATTRATTQAINKSVKHSVQQSILKYRTKSNLNMREKPQGAIMQTLKKGTEVEVVDKNGGVWWQVSSNNETGWVHSNYLVE
jgi:uncharacterized protein YgiM (DUF1202 family)